MGGNHSLLHEIAYQLAELVMLFSVFQPFGH
jgi:hypothetical protein